MTDLIYQKIAQKLAQKYIQGMKEHGLGLQAQPNDLKAWVIALQEEAMDTVAYCEKIIQCIEEGEL